jgi:hypothetical protein
MVVVKERRRTSEEVWMYRGSLSSHATGTPASALVYTSRSKVQGSSSRGRKVTDAVICRMMAEISPWMSLWLFCRTTLREGRGEQGKWTGKASGG